MKSEIATDLVATRLAQTIRDYSPRHPTKFQKLLLMKDSIAELRSKGASYATIADILRNINVPVAGDTVFRFCHEILGEPMTRRRKKRRHALRNPLEQVPIKMRREHPTGNSQKGTNQMIRDLRHMKEPPIADPNTI